VDIYFGKIIQGCPNVHVFWVFQIFVLFLRERERGGEGEREKERERERQREREIISCGKQE